MFNRLYGDLNVASYDWIDKSLQRENENLLLATKSADEVLSGIKLLLLCKRN